MRPLVKTAADYWCSTLAVDGPPMLYCAQPIAQLLVPMALEHAVEQMQRATEIVVSAGSWNGVPAVELLFDDGSLMPFSVILPRGLCLPNGSFDPAIDQVAVTTAQGEAMLRPVVFQVVQSLPHQQAFVRH